MNLGEKSIMVNGPESESNQLFFDNDQNKIDNFLLTRAHFITRVADFYEGMFTWKGEGLHYAFSLLKEAPYDGYAGILSYDAMRLERARRAVQEVTDNLVDNPEKKGEVLGRMFLNQEQYEKGMLLTDDVDGIRRTNTLWDGVKKTLDEAVVGETNLCLEIGLLERNGHLIPVKAGGVFKNSLNRKAIYGSTETAIRDRLRLIEHTTLEEIVDFIEGEDSLASRVRKIIRTEGDLSCFLGLSFFYMLSDDIKEISFILAHERAHLLDSITSVHYIPEESTDLGKMQHITYCPRGFMGGSGTSELVADLFKIHRIERMYPLRDEPRKRMLENMRNYQLDEFYPKVVSELVRNAAKKGLVVQTSRLTDPEERLSTEDVENLFTDSKTLSKLSVKQYNALHNLSLGDYSIYELLMHRAVESLTEKQQRELLRENLDRVIDFAMHNREIRPDFIGLALRNHQVGPMIYEDYEGIPRLLKKIKPYIREHPLP